MIGVARAVASALKGGGGSLGGPYRYLRAEFDDSVSSTLLIFREVAYYDGVGGRFPDTMTSDSAPSPFVASASSFSYVYTAFRPFLAFDRTDSFFATSDGADANSWLQVDLGSEVFYPDGGRVEVRPSGVDTAPSSVRIVASNTGAFAGEEVELMNAPGLLAGDWTLDTASVFSF